jgi:hypothetical protein
MVWPGRIYVAGQGLARARPGLDGYDHSGCNKCPDLAEGDWLDLAYNLPEAAKISGLSQYELLTLLGRRFLREKPRPAS